MIARLKYFRLFLCLALLAARDGTAAVAAAATNSVPVEPLPDMGPSVLRVFGALALVIGIFLGGVWLFRNWQRLALSHGRRPKLNIIETRPLGGRQSLYVVGYEQGRYLVASSPNGITLLTHLPDASHDEEPAADRPPAFPAILSQVLKPK